MRVTFYGVPRSLIRDSQTKRMIARFDKNGRYTTEDELLIKRMKSRGFQWEEKEVIEEKIVKKSEKLDDAKSKIKKKKEKANPGKEQKSGIKPDEKVEKSGIKPDEKVGKEVKEESLQLGEVPNPYLENTHDELKDIAKEKKMTGNYWLMSAETLADELFKLDNEVK